MDNKFNVEELYQEYLQLARFNEEKMHPIQRAELRRSFMAGCGMMLQTLKEIPNELPEDEAVELLENMDNQVKQFFINEVEKLIPIEEVEELLGIKLNK